MGCTAWRSGDLGLVQLAARNNAEWCDDVCRTHGVIGTFHPEVWASDVRTPELYPDAVALDPSLSADRVLSYVDDSVGCSIKDSFGVMDLRSAAFRVLFEAEWIYLDTYSGARDRETRFPLGGRERCQRLEDVGNGLGWRCGGDWDLLA